MRKYQTHQKCYYFLQILKKNKICLNLKNLTKRHNQQFKKLKL